MKLYWSRRIMKTLKLLCICGLFATALAGPLTSVLAPAQLSSAQKGTEESNLNQPEPKPRVKRSSVHDDEWQRLVELLESLKRNSRNELRAIKEIRNKEETRMRRGVGYQPRPNDYGNYVSNKHLIDYMNRMN